jgi:hypothetical protein
VRDHTGQHVRTDAGPRSRAALGAICGALLRHRGGDLVADVLGGSIDAFGLLPGVGRIGEVSVVSPEDRPIPSGLGPVGLPRAIGLGGEFGDAPHAGASTGPQLRVLIAGASSTIDWAGAHRAIDNSQ